MCRFGTGPRGTSPRPGAASLALALAVLTGALSAPAGEASEKQPPLDPPHLTQLRLAVARSGTVVVAKITATEGMKADEAVPNQPQMHMVFGQVPASGRAQRLRCQVTEVLRGREDLKEQELEVLARHFSFSFGPRRTLLWPGAQMPEEQMKKFPLVAGQSCLLVLMPDETAAPSGRGAGTVYTTVLDAVRQPPAEVLEIVCGLAKRIREYDNPPELTAEQSARAREDLEALASADYGVRLKATEALLAAGPAVLGLVRRTAKDSRDLETRLRCEQIIEDLKPLPGADPKLWAGDAAIRKPVEEKPPDDDGQEDDLTGAP